MKLLDRPANLFRSAQSALERKVGQGSEGLALQPSRLWVRSITWSLIGCTGFGLAWLALAQTEEIVVATGSLEPIGSVREVEMPVGGIAEKILVKEGQQVKAGQVLVQLDAESTQQKQRSVEQAIRLKQQELVLKQLELQRYLEMNDEQVRNLQQTLALEQDIADRLKGLAQQGGIGELQYLGQRNKVQQVTGQLREAKADRLRQTAVLNQNMEQLRSNLAQLQAEVSEARVTVRYQSLRSPVNGVVFDLKPAGRGYVANSNEPILKIVPFDKLQANVEVASSDIGFVHSGMATDVSVDSFPATDFGVLQGKVKQVGSDALPPDPQKQRDTYRYPVTISLLNQQLKLKSGQYLPLQVGMTLTAHIKLRKVTYLQLLLGSFKDKADSLRQI